VTPLGRRRAMSIFVDKYANYVEKSQRRMMNDDNDDAVFAASSFFDTLQLWR
jgi:hypothetical protein